VATETIQVLLVEDNPGDVGLVRQYLGEDAGSEFELIHVSTVREAVEYLRADTLGIDAVLLDLSLPDESGLNTLRRVVEATSMAVVVVMTGGGDEDLGLTALREGAQDYLVKDTVTGPTLRRALRFAIGRQFKLQSLSHKDDLTGLNNRRGFLLLVEQQIKIAKRQRTPFHLLFLDLDDLKAVNDTFGHAEGNRAIVEAADLLRGCFRQSDVLARFGGDEFAAFALSADGTGDAAVRERIAAALARVNSRPDRPYRLGFSLGVLACGPGEDGSVEALLERADALMYQEKRQKRRHQMPVG
jgi:diguanylate cyclase (GGDEF)-like protein